MSATIAAPHTRGRMSPCDCPPVQVSCACEACTHHAQTEGKVLPLLAEVRHSNFFQAANAKTGRLSARDRHNFVEWAHGASTRAVLVRDTGAVRAVTA